MTSIQNWGDLPHIDNNEVSQIITDINEKKVTPQGLYDRLAESNQYLNTEQLRHIQEGCENLFLNSKNEKWYQSYQYDHALCARVTDRWNLKAKFGAEGYYYCTEDYAKNHDLPPLNWKPMNQSLQKVWW